MPQRAHGPVRKQLLRKEIFLGPPLGPAEIDLTEHALIHYSSEDPRHSIDNLFDGLSVPGATRWAGARPDNTEEIVLQLDGPHYIARLEYDVEEREVERTQEVRLELSSDGGKSYKSVLVQEYNFSPYGATYQHERVSIETDEVTHLRLTVVPNKRGSGAASLTSLRLFGR